jgi:chemotaxis protein methyltransferase CheR
VKKSLAMIAELVQRETGVLLPPGRVTALRTAVGRVAPGLDLEAFLRATSDPVHGRGLVERLIDEVTVQETTFVRDRRQLDMIDWDSLLRGVRVAGSGTIRVWSAGCATGEEAYTLALLATEALAMVRVPVDVLGTDISGAALAAAAVGRYRERAVGGLQAQLRERYLERQSDGSHLVGERLRRLVRFRRHNLARDPIPPRGEAGFDLVVCRNVLIYFDPPLGDRVIVSLTRSLRAGGMLVLGAADALQRSSAGRSSDGPAAAGTAPPRAYAFRRPLGRQPSLSREHQLAAALAAADKGDSDSALALVAPLIAVNSLDADAHFVQGLVTLEAGNPARAAAALRRALYADNAFALAAFTLGRAYDALGDSPAARRAYEQALRMLDPEDHRHELMLQQVDIGDIAVACRSRLAARP